MNQSQMTFATWIIAVTLLACTATTIADETIEHPPQALMIRCTAYRIAASISGDTSLTEDVGLRDSAGQTTATTDRITFFTLADMVIGGTSFSLDEQGARWNNELSPPPDSDITELATPKIAVWAGQPWQIRIGGTENYQYMQRIEDERFQLREIELETGLELAGRLEQGGGGAALFDPLTLTLRSIQGREPLLGVTLNIGKPVVTSDEVTHAIRMMIGRPYGMFWHTRQGSLLLIFELTPATLEIQSGREP
jgi:hypothetical protein